MVVENIYSLHSIYIFIDETFNFFKDILSTALNAIKIFILIIDWTFNFFKDILSTALNAIKIFILIIDWTFNFFKDTLNTALNAIKMKVKIYFEIIILLEYGCSSLKYLLK